MTKYFCDICNSEVEEDKEEHIMMHEDFFALLDMDCSKE
jgi:hypothetical protein